MSSFVRFFGWGIFLLALVDGGPCRAQEDVLKYRLLHEAPEAWTRYCARASRLQGSYSVKHNPISASKPGLSLHVDGEVKQAENCFLTLEQSHLDKKVEMLSGSNSKYGFELKRTALRNEWQLTKLLEARSKEVKAIQQEVEDWTTCSVSLFLINGSNFYLKDLQSIFKKAALLQQDGKDLVRVDVEYTSSNPRIRSFFGWVTLDPANFWVIVDLKLKWQLVQEKNGSITATFQHQQTNDGFPIIKQIQMRIKQPWNGYETENTFEFDYRDTDVSESAFTLSAFGLPEPKGVVWDHGGSRAYLWLAGCAVASLAAGVVFWRRVQRRKLLAAKA